jgi:hypothetical protein
VVENAEKHARGTSGSTRVGEDTIYSQLTKRVRTSLVLGQTMRNAPRQDGWVTLAQGDERGENRGRAGISHITPNKTPIVPHDRTHLHSS